MIAYLRHSGPPERIFVLDLTVLGLSLESRVERLARQLGTTPQVLAVTEEGFAQWFQVVTRFAPLRREDGSFTPEPDLLAYLDDLPSPPQTPTAHPEG